MKVKISKNNLRGSVVYDENNQDVEIIFPDTSIRTEIEEYLETKQIFKIPESQETDDCRADFALPLDNIMYFQLAMGALWAETGVMVHW